MFTCRYFDKCTNMYFCVHDVSYFIYIHIIYSFNYIIYHIKMCTFDVMIIVIAIKKLLKNLMDINCYIIILSL